MRRCFYGLYIFTEDETSGYDFIKHIIQKVNPTLQYIIDTARGCKYLLKLLNNYSTIFKPNDIIVLYFDYSTLNVSELDAWYYNHSNLTVYLQGFYCFESVFFTYVRFLTGEINMGVNQKMFKDFAMVLKYNKNSELLTGFKNNYNIQYVGTLEQYANYIFNRCTQKYMPCINVNKHNYIDLDTSLQDNETYFKYFYLNKCDCNNMLDYKKLQHNKLSYCMEKHKLNLCVYTKHGINLVDFYYNSILRSPFLLYQLGGGI